MTPELETADRPRLARGPRILVLALAVVSMVVGAAYLALAMGSSGEDQAVLYSARGRVLQLEPGADVPRDLGPGTILAWSSDHRSAAVAVDGRLVRLDIATDVRLDLGPAPEEATWSRDGRWLLATTGGQATVFDTTTGTATALGAAPLKSGRPAWAPDADRAVAVGLDGDDRALALVAVVDGRPMERTVHVAAQPTGEVTFGPNGKIAFLAVDAIAIVGADGSDERTLVRDLRGSGPVSPAWSGDGTRIAFLAHDGNDTVRIVDVGTGTVAQVVDLGPASALGLAWSPDGASLRVILRVVCTCSPDPTTEVRWYGLDGTLRRAMDLGTGIDEVAP